MINCQRSDRDIQNFTVPLKVTNKTNLVDLVDIWDINFDGMRREFRVEQEGGVQMTADEIRVNVPFREDLVWKTWSDLIPSEFWTTNQ